MSTRTVSGLWIHPIKGCRAVPVQQATLDRYGLVGDRRALVCRPDGSMITQRSHPQLATVTALWEGEALIARAEGAGELQVPPVSELSERRTATVWGSAGLQARDAGTEATAWWSDFLGERVHLVLMGHDYTRPLKSGRGQLGDEVSFADGAPLLVAHEASLAQLNRWLTEKGEAVVPLDRFRPNIGISGGEAFEEDGWSSMTVGSVALGYPWPCARCAVTTTDQSTGLRGVEPLRTLAKYRRDREKPTDVNFGINWVPKTKNGVLRVGDPVLGYREA